MRISAGFFNGIGNFIFYTCALQAFAKIAGQPIDLLLDDVWEGPDRDSIELMASKMPFIKKVVGYPSGFKGESYDHVFMSHHSVAASPLFHSIYPDIAAEAPNLPFWPFLFEHERDYYLREIRAQIGVQPQIYPQYMPVSDSFPYLLPEGLKIVLANGYKRSAYGPHTYSRKMWPHFGELIEDLINYYPEATVCLVGSEEDKKEWKNVVRTDNKNVINFSGKLNILETAYLIQESSLIIANDSAIFHVAEALNRPGIVLFGSTLVSKNGPLGNSFEIIRSPLKCSPCQGSVQFKMCTDHSRCMKAIKPELIMAYVRKLLRFY